jgi:hypothetical protein
MSIYRVHVRRHTYPRLGNEGLSTGINWPIPDAVIIASEQPDSLHEHLSLQLARDDYLQAANEIGEAVQRLGYTLLNIEIRELVDKTVEATILGAAGPGGVIHLKMKNPLLTAIVMLVGGYIANRVATQLKRYEVVYRFSLSPSGWTLNPIERMDHSRVVAQAL